LLNIVTGPFLLGQGLGEEAFLIGMTFLLLAGCSLGIGGLIASFFRNCRGMSIGFSVAAIGLWLSEALYIFVEGGRDFQWVIEVISRRPSLLLMHPPLLLAIAALIIQQSRSQSPKN